MPKQMTYLSAIMKYMYLISSRNQTKKDTNVLSAYSPLLGVKINVTPEMPEFQTE